MKAETATVGVQNLVFSRWIEVKHKAEPNNYIEFFLVTDTGNEVLAITAEDHGNSHYVYQSTGTFANYGALNSKNRADTISWLEMIVKESQVKVDSQLAEEMAHVGEPTPDNPLGLYYTQHKAEKTANLDGTHTQRFFLLDQYGTWHLAVIGEERETRDGHYQYKATEEFSTRYPLSCHAQKDVIHWLEQRVTHNLLQPPPPPQHRGDGSGGVSAAVSGAGGPSGGSADAWGPTDPGATFGTGYAAAATPTSAADGMAGSEGAELVLQLGDASPRQLTPPPAAVSHFANHQQPPQDALALPELLPQQQQLPDPQQQLPDPQQQPPGFSGFPVAAASGGPAGLLQQQQQPFGASSSAANCGVQPSDGAAQGTGEPPPHMLPLTAPQALSGLPLDASTSSSSQFLSNHVGVHPTQTGQHAAPANTPAMALPDAQQQLSQNGNQHPLVGAYQHHNLQKKQPPPGLFVNNSSGHAGPAAATALATSTDLASGLPALSLQHQQHHQQQQQQQQHDASAMLQQQRGPTAVPTMSHAQQDARSQSGYGPQQPQQQPQFPMLVSHPLQLQQQRPQGQHGSQASLQAEPQGLAQLLGLAGLASSMQGGNVSPQLPRNGPPLQLQLPLPPQLQLQGSNVSQMTTPLPQQFMVPNLFQQQQQQPLLPFPQFNAQTQLQQEQQLQLLQQQYQQQQQQLEQLLQCSPGGSAISNVGAGGHQQQQQQLLPPPGAALHPPGPALNSLLNLPAGGQAWNAGGGLTPAASGTSQQHAETSALPPISGQARMASALQLPGLLPTDLSAGAAGVDLSGFRTAAAAPAGYMQGPGGTAVSGSIGQSRSFAGPTAAGRGGAAGSSGLQGPDQVGGGGAGGSEVGLGMAAWPAGLAGGFFPSDNMFPPHPHPYPQQPQQQPFGHPGGVANMGGLLGAASFPCGGGGCAGVGPFGGSGGPMGAAAGLHCGGGSTPLSFSGGVPMATVTGAGAPPPSAMGPPSGFGMVGSAGGLAIGGSSAAAAAAGPFQQPFGDQAGAPGMLLPAVRTREAGLLSGHHGGRGGAGGRGSSGKHKLAGVAEVAHKRKLARLAAAGEEPVRLAQGAYLASLRHQALSEAAQHEALRKTIASWVRGQISEDEVSVSGWHENLEQMLRDANRTRCVSAPFLPTERMLEITRGSVEAITLAAAMSLASPYDPTAPPYTPLPAPAPPLYPVSAPTPAAVVGSYPAPVAGGAGIGAQPVIGLPSSEEQLAAVSSLKALLMGDLNAAVLGLAAPAAVAATTPGSQQAAGGSNGTGAGPVGMHADRADAGVGQAETGALAAELAEQSTEDVHMADGSAGTTPFAAPNAAVTASGAAAPVAVGLPPPPAAATAPFPAASAPAAAPHLNPTAAVGPPPAPLPPSLPIVPTRPTGPVGAAAVLACAGSAKSWSYPDPHMNRHGVRIALESLREVAALCPPVASMASSNLVETVKQYESHPHPSVSGLAKEILKRWRGSLIHRLRSMSDSRCYQDPVAALESKIQANEIVFPNLNELLGVPRGCAVATATADGATPSAAPLAAGGLYTPSAAAPAGTGFAVGGNTAYSLAATPMVTGLPATPPPPLTLTAAGTPLLSAVGVSATTKTPNGGLGVVGGGAPGGGNLMATTTAETPRGLFDTAGAPRPSGDGSFPTPQLFSRPSGGAALLAPGGPGVLPLELPALALQPPGLVFPPLSPLVAPSPAATAAPSPPPMAAAQTAMAAAKAVAPAPMAEPPQLAQPPTPGRASASAPAPQPPSPPPLPPLSSPSFGAAFVAASAPMAAPALTPAPTEAPAPPALTPLPSPLKTPTTAAAAAPLQSPVRPATAAAATRPVAGTEHATGPAVPPPPPPVPSGGASGSMGPVAAPAFGMPSQLLPGLPLLPQATTAEIAALLAASAQSLAAHIQTSAAAGSGGGVPPPPFFSSAQLNQLGALATTTKIYASALKTSDTAGAASAWQSMVQQLRQAHALNLGLGVSALGGVPQRPLFMPSPSTSAAAAPVQPPQLTSAWPAATWAASLQPPQAVPLTQPLQIQPLQLQRLPSPSLQPIPSSGQPQQAPAPGSTAPEAPPAVQAGDVTVSTTAAGTAAQVGAAVTHAAAAATDAAAAVAPQAAEESPAASLPPTADSNATPEVAVAAATPPSLPGATADAVATQACGLKATGGSDGGEAADATVRQGYDGTEGTSVALGGEGGGAAMGGPGPLQGLVVGGELLEPVACGAPGQGQGQGGEGGPSAADGLASGLQGSAATVAVGASEGQGVGHGLGGEGHAPIPDGGGCSPGG